MPKAKRRVKNKDNNRRAKKKVSVLTSERIEYVDWKDVNLLRRFMSERAKIRSRRVTGNSAQQQKLVADAIKVAREMALVAYSNRVTTQRQGKDRSSRLWADTPMPRPAMPPPGGIADPAAADDDLEAVPDSPPIASDDAGRPADPAPDADPGSGAPEYEADPGSGAPEYEAVESSAAESPAAAASAEPSMESAQP